MGGHGPGASLLGLTSGSATVCETRISYITSLSLHFFIFKMRSITPPQHRLVVKPQ